MMQKSRADLYALRGIGQSGLIAIAQALRLTLTAGSDHPLSKQGGGLRVALLHSNVKTSK